MYRPNLKILPFLFLALILNACQKKSTYEPKIAVTLTRVIDSSAAWGVFLSTTNGNLLFIQKATPIEELNAVNVGIHLIFLKNDLTVLQKKVVFEKKDGDKLFVQNIDSSFYTYQCRNFSVGQLSNGRIILGFTLLRYNYDKMGNGKVDPVSGSIFQNLGLFQVTSDNNGETFSQPKKIDTDNILMPNTHFNIINLSNGKSLMSVYGSTNKNSTTSESSIYSSNDYGLSWNKYSSIRKSNTPPFGETTLVKTKFNLLAFVRTENNNCLRYISNDEGLSWSTPIVVSDTMQVPAGAVSLYNRNILLFTGNRKPPLSIVSRKSIDFGLSFLEPVTIAFVDSYNSGYPNGIQLIDGSILMTYYNMPTVPNEYKNNWINSTITVSRFPLEKFD